MPLLSGTLLRAETVTRWTNSFSWRPHTYHHMIMTPDDHNITCSTSSCISSVLLRSIPLLTIIKTLPKAQLTKELNVLTHSVLFGHITSWPNLGFRISPIAANTPAYRSNYSLGATPTPGTVLRERKTTERAAAQCGKSGARAPLAGQTQPMRPDMCLIYMSLRCKCLLRQSVLELWCYHHNKHT